MDKSKGHILFAEGPRQVIEFFQRDGNVYRVPVAAPIMDDGYRIGRWESAVWHFEQFKDVILRGMKIVIL